MTSPDTMNGCERAAWAIRDRDVIGWQGLPTGCRPEDLFGVPVDDQWGERQLGEDCEPARSRLLDIDGYYRPMAFVRDGDVVLFDGMNPALSVSWRTLADDLGEPETRLDWVHGTVPMPAGEMVYARRGITVSLNPSNEFVAYLTLYPPTDVDHYVRLLRQSRAKWRGL